MGKKSLPVSFLRLSKREIKQISGLRLNKNGTEKDHGKMRSARIKIKVHEMNVHASSLIAFTFR